MFLPALAKLLLCRISLPFGGSRFAESVPLQGGVPGDSPSPYGQVRKGRR